MKIHITKNAAAINTACGLYNAFGRYDSIATNNYPNLKLVMNSPIWPSDTCHNCLRSIYVDVMEMALDN